MQKSMKPLVPLALLMLAACASPGPATPDTDQLAPDFGSPGEANYHLLMAEIALQRDRPALAATEYLRAARASDDPEIAARATQVIGVYGTREEGLEAARRWVELTPDDSAPRTYLVRFHLQGGDAEQAAAELAWLRADLDVAAVERPFVALLPLALETGDRAAALTAMSTVAAGYPGDASGAYAIAYLALRSGDPALAQAEATRALGLDPGWTDAALVYARALAADGRTEEALEWLSTRPEAQQRGVRLERAVLLMSAERIDEARQLLEELLADIPDDPAALRALGYLEYFDDRPAAAREAFMALLATGQYTSDALFYLGGIAEQEGDIEEAAHLYSRVEGGEHQVTAQVRLALLMFRMGRPELAINHLELFARRNPEAELELGGARAELLARLGMQDEARVVYDELLERHPDDFDLRYARGLLLVQLGEVDDALDDFGHLVALYPDDPTALNALGYTLADMTERHEEAYGLISRALEQAPDSPAVLDSMGWVLYRLGRPGEGLPYIERAWEILADAEIAAHLGELLWSLGRVDEARETWLQAIVEWPGSEILLETMGRLDP
jgi:tetratricopeptide (TPR) repeat protein